MYDLQKASMLKRISAALLDLILLVILITGVAFLLSAVLGYDEKSERLEAHYETYEKAYGIDFDISANEYEKLSPEQKDVYEEADRAFSQDVEVGKAYETVLNLTFIIITFSILLAYLLLEFLVPLFFRNGQTIGKKIFGIGVMRQDGVKLPTVLLFTRTVLGKCTVETLVPVMLVLMMLFGILGIEALVLVGALLLVQLVMIIAFKTRTPIHDKLAQTVTVDLSSQMIFDTPEELLAYKQRIHASEAGKKPYP